MLSTLASEEDVAEVAALYHDVFDGFNPDEQSTLDVPTIDVPLVQEGEFDPGVLLEAKMTPDHLAEQLGFVSGRPILFNSHRHVGGLTAWDSDIDIARFTEKAGNNDDSDMEPFTLMWSQLAGVHAAVRSYFSDQPFDQKTLGTLISDEVGLGKTFLSASLIGFLCDAINRQTLKIPPAPVLRKFS